MCFKIRSDPRFLEQRNWCRSGYFHESSCRFPSYSSVVDVHTRRYSRQVNVRHVSSKRSALIMPSLATGANIVGGPRRGALPCRPEPPGTRVGDAASGQWRLGRSRLTRRARARASASGNAGRCGRGRAWARCAVASRGSRGCRFYGIIFECQKTGEITHYSEREPARPR